MIVCKFPKPGLLGRILWGFGEAHPTGDSWNDAMRHWPEEFIWKIELLMIVENPTRNLSRKSSSPHLWVWPRRLPGVLLIIGVWWQTVEPWFRFSVYTYTHISGEFRKSIRVFGDLCTFKYLQVPTSIWRWPLWGCLATLGLCLASAPGLRCTIPVYPFTGIVYYTAVLVYWYSVFYYCTGMLI